jgi:ATP-dependent helicase HrpB
MLLDAGILGDKQVFILQPRRLPTRLLASWVAKARGVNLGDEVGYQMRLDSLVSPATRICYVTEGVLLRRMLSDPELRDVGAIIFDEFHERHIYGDITLARALDLQTSSRPDLKIIVMSATLDVGVIDKYLQPCAILSSEGRMHPVAVEYLSNPVTRTPVWELAAKELARLVREHEEGDALVFMAGTYEITRTLDAARAVLGNNFAILPLHGELPPKEQDAAIAHSDRRKVVVATNVAETSLTINGIRLVIDSGLARVPRFDPYRGINTLLIEKISRAAADQRAGRAGRTAPGHCLRLWTAHQQTERPAQEVPEIKRLDLSEVVLTLKASGVTDLKAFRWIETPDPRALERAEALLSDLGAIDPASGAITDIGRRMLAFPMHPRYARMLLTAQGYKCVRPIALIAALTQGRDLLFRRGDNRQNETPDDAKFQDAGSDFFVLMRAFRSARAANFDPQRCREMGINAQAARQTAAVFDQFLRIADEEGLDTKERPVSSEAIQRCVLVGFSDHLARRLDENSLRCELVHGRRGVLPRACAIKAPLFVACEVREVESRSVHDRVFNVVLSLATAVKQEWLEEFFPEGFREFHSVVYEPALRRVVSRRELRFRDLVLEQQSSEQPPKEEAARILAREVASGRCVLDHWDDTVEQWILRVNRLHEWMPELGLPTIDNEQRESIVAHVCYGAVSAAAIKTRPVLPVVKSWLSEEQQSWVERYAPERIELPNRRRTKIVYSAENPPTVAARIQDLYGVKEGLWIANRRVPLRIEILAPSNRPVQITDNLSAFWRDTYPKLKEELRRRYPKHEWR